MFIYNLRSFQTAHTASVLRSSHLWQEARKPYELSNIARTVPNFYSVKYKAMRPTGIWSHFAALEYIAKVKKTGLLLNKYSIDGSNIVATTFTLFPTVSNVLSSHSLPSHRIKLHQWCGYVKFVQSSRTFSAQVMQSISFIPRKSHLSIDPHLALLF